MENKIKKNYGFIPPEIVPEDFWLGSGKLGSVVLNEKGDWRPYLPAMEKQNMGFEPNACVSFGTLSALEILNKFQYKIEPNYSDRFLAKKSGTDPNSGNTPKIVSDTFRHSGTIPEEKWPMTENLEEYYKEIPQQLLNMGKQFLEEYKIGYEWVDKSQLKNALKRSPVGVAVSAWEQNDKGEYVWFGIYNHWCVLVAFDEQDRPIIWDSYDIGLKTLEKDYPFGFPQLYTLKEKEQEKTARVCQRIIEWFKKLWKI